jgi:branched-chain amino acid transport system substrate-binding protein
MKKNILVSTFFLLGCISSLELSADTQQTIKVGTLLTLTGSTAQFGANSRDAMELARQEINKSGGIHGSPLEILYENFSYERLRDVPGAVQRLVEIEKVEVLFTQWAEDTEVAYPIVERKKLPTITVAAGSRDITKGRKYLFRVWPSDGMLITRVIDYVGNTLGKKENPCIFAEETSYFESMKELAQEEWMRIANVQPVIVSHPTVSEDFRPYLQKYKACGSLLLLSGYGNLPSILRRIQDLRMKAVLMSHPSFAADEVTQAAGDAANGVIYALYPSAKKDFEEKFREAYHRDPAPPAASAYDAVYVVAKAMKALNASQYDSEQFLDTLQQVSKFSGASGEIEFTSERDRKTLPSTLYHMINGKAEVLITP